MAEPVRDEVFGYCHRASQLGELIAATRWAMIAIVLGPVTTEHTCRFGTQVERPWRRMGSAVRTVLSDRSPSTTAFGSAATSPPRRAPRVSPGS
jgi:hypothetical protein